MTTEGLMQRCRQAVTALVPVAVWLLCATGCASSPTVESIRGLSYSHEMELDVFYRTDVESSPIVVVLHGAPSDRHDYERFSLELAGDGAVVFNADWSVLPPSTLLALEEISCAVRFARQNGPVHGGDPDRLVLVAHSSATGYAGRVSTGLDEFTGRCDVEGSPRPDGLALLSSAVIPGGAPWPQASLGGNPEVRVALIHGTDDRVASPLRSARTAQILNGAGYDVIVEAVPGGHNDLVNVSRPNSLDPAGPQADAATAETIAIVLELVPDDVPS